MAGDIQDVMGGHEFDCNQVEPQQPREPVPAGWYVVMIADAEVKETKARTGWLMNIDYQIVDGDHKDRHVFQNLNLRNPNQKAEEIGMRQLSSLGRATGVMNIKDTADLKDKVLQIKVVVKDDKEYGPKNEVKDFKSVEGVTPTATSTPSSAPAQTTAPTEPAADVPPWKR